MADQVCGGYFLKRRAEGGDKLRRQVGNKTDRVGQDGLFDTGQGDGSHCRVECCEEQVLGHDIRTGQAIE